jgi:rhodanese-related sulfurtransferase
MTVFDLEEAELCYAPQFGSAKDPVNMAGFVAAGVVRGEHPIAHSDQLERLAAEQAFLLDVRTPEEFAAGAIEGAMNIPLEELRERLDEIPLNRHVVAYCKVGQRGYMATRALQHHGFEASNLSGGILTHEQRRSAAQAKAKSS